MKPNPDNSIEQFGDVLDVFPTLIPLNGKVPIEPEWTLYCEESRFFDETDFKNHNAGIPCGPANGIIVIDVDHPEKFERMCKENGWDLPVTRRHLTGTGKPHIIYQYPKNGKRYGNRAFKDREGNSIFDVRGVGGQVVAPGSIHPETGKPYRVSHELPIVEAPQWLLGLYSDEPPKAPHSAGGLQGGDIDIESLPISFPIKNLIRGGMPKGKRSEAIASVLSALIKTKVSDEAIVNIFNTHRIGEKYREKGDSRDRWLQAEIKRLRKFTETKTKDVSSRVREYLLDEFDGGIFKISDLKRELGLNDNEYTLARNCVKRMQGQGHLQKHGHQLGCYRVVDRRKNSIVWDEIEAGPSGLILPGGLHKVVTTREGDMICFAGYKNHNKTAIAIETARLNLDRFEIHFFITEYQARMKKRLLDFGIDLSHPNLNCYPIDRGDYIPDKIEGGAGVLNIIDHFPNLDNFYLVGKYQDEIHRALDGALCVITHQKKNPDDLEAIGGSFWTITPTLAVTLLQENDVQIMRIRKGKEPGAGIYNALNMVIRYKLRRGCEFEFDTQGWK
ncbi:hypothetical protein C6A37_01400 [Desulfobacteraceae bacterium SEEP-SAG9]|nr:hypothetical protein C6A37_01400 [Desulfobacteraceae bacterium SEEP-SAG9]